MSKTIWTVLNFCCLLACINGLPNLLYATTKDIRITNVLPKAPKTTVLVRDLGDGSALDFYYEGGLICWTDHGLEMIQCIPYNGTHLGEKVEVATTMLMSPDGLACDWFTEKLYWTDGETNRIEVATITGQHRKVLIWDDIDQPRAIALVPMKSIMFWTDWGEAPKIERAGMNGDPATRKVIIVDQIFWPNGLTVDYVSETLYWTDGRLKFIASVDYEGRNRKTIVKPEVEYPFAISMFQSKLYWTDWKTWAIHVYDRSEPKSLPKELIHGRVVPMDIKVWDEGRQPKGDTACRRNNGGCSHLCLLAPYAPGYSCACPTGVKLIDNTTCADGAQELLLLVQRTDICKISLDSPDYTNFVLPLKDIMHAIAIDYDPVEKYIYFTDEEARALRRARLDGSDQEDLITTEVKHPDGIAVDWLARNLYWTDAGTNRIEVARLTGASRKVLINKDLGEPRAIAVAPEHGWLFWSDWDEKWPKIERSSLDGSDRKILASDELGWPNGIALDLERDKIYWCDAKRDQIEVANMDGSDRREVISDNMPHLFGLSLLGDYLYWTDWQRRSIDRVNKLTGNDRKVIVDLLPNVMGIKAVKMGPVAKGKNPCTFENGGCSHLCLNRPKNDYVCACQIGYELTSDGRTCVVPEAFLLFARKENIGRISIENGNNDVLIPVTGVKDASALDFDITDNRIYWTDVKVKAITRAFMNGSDVEKIVEFGLDSPEGMAIDWVAHNVYWTDTGSKRIEVSRLDGRSRKVLLWERIEEPKSLALDPKEGYMYWSDWGKPGSLERASMDGSKRTHLVSKVGRANGLTIDYVKRRIYWTELNHPAIESSDMEGNGRVRIVTSDIDKPFGLTQYRDNIYWTDWNTGKIECANKTTGQNRTRIHSDLESITDILVFHTSRQSGWNQCAVSNGGCSNLCLAMPGSGGSPANRQSNTHKCGCPTHYTLEPSDNRTCVPPTSFILFGGKNSISRLMPNTSDCPDVVLPIQGLKNIRAMEFDPATQFVYWVDGRSLTIRRSLANGSSAGSLTAGASGGLHHPYDLAIDPFARLLFWTCAQTDAIKVTRLDTSLLLGVVVKADDEKPRNIAVHPEKGFLFWTDLGKGKRVMRATMDGLHKVTVAELSEDPVAIAVDRILDLVFWASVRNIETSDLDGKNRRSLVSVSLVQVTNLAVHGDYLYWVDRDQQQIERVWKTTGANRTVVMRRLTQLTDLVSVTFPSTQVYKDHGCSHVNEHNGCSHICHALNSTFVCSCPDGLTLHEDGKGCTAVPACGADTFTCLLATKDCIPLSWRCDGQNDCPDNSDEAGCPGCHPDQFQCPTGQCIDLKWVCDGMSQCPDNYDERNCCKHGEFACAGTGDCIPGGAVCDGYENCKDGSDESTGQCNNNVHSRVGTVPYGSTSKATTVVFVLIGLASIVFLAAFAYFCRKRILGAGGVDARGMDDSAGDPLSPKPPRATVKPICVTTGVQSYRGGKLGTDAVHMSMLNGSSTSNSYDRSHITGASSSTTENGHNGHNGHNGAVLVGSSSLLGYPRETLNPPPSPATTADSNRRIHHHNNYMDDYCCSGASSGVSKYKPYRHYRSINQPPPPTPCSTDVCDESDSNYPPPRGRHRYYAPPGSEYDSDPFPPPPTPRSHYHSDGNGGGQHSSCPPSPSSTAGRSSTYFNPLPPPPSPVPSPASRRDC